MKTQIIMAVILLGTAIVPSNAASVIRDHRTPANNTGPMSPIVGVAELSSAECRKLGGGVHKFDVCNSRRACVTRDQNGKYHAVCIRTVLDGIMSGWN
ncbi:hypothetical protein [Oricola sp.]|uniref:hypothetical protein n=1 Tax=Oricola sp. TaxID=1979950 RepID=UPI0025E06C76|nr:hypothetical protein [Oricola sp.]MCI5078180.1 hypothetical protein [Oricola sp.]